MSQDAIKALVAIEVPFNLKNRLICEFQKNLLEGKSMFCHQALNTTLFMVASVTYYLDLCKAITSPL